MKYQEDRKATAFQKQKYADGFERLIRRKNEEAAKIRAEYAKGIFEDAETFRSDFYEMLGWPLTDNSDREVPKAEGVLLSKEDGFEIYRMSISVTEELSVYGLLFRHNEGKRPLVIAQHGAMGSPELAAGFFEGNTYNYNDMIMRVLKTGVNVFAPQTMTWYFGGSDNGYGVKADRIELDGKLKRVGSSVTAVEVYAIMRIIDYFEKESYVSCFGMVGLSYGGFFTLFTAACDTRIKAAVSSSFFNERDKYPWTDWTWNNAAFKFADAEIACLIYPRRLWIGVGTRDEAFSYESAGREIERLKKMCKEVGSSWLNITEADAAHEFCISDEELMKFAGYLKNI